MVFGGIRRPGFVNFTGCLLGAGDKCLLPGF